MQEKLNNFLINLIFLINSSVYLLNKLYCFRRKSAFFVVLFILSDFLAISFRHEQRKKDEQRMRRRLNKNKGLWVKINSNLPPWLLFNTKGKYGLLLAAATVIIGFYAYYIKTTNPRFSFFG